MRKGRSGDGYRLFLCSQPSSQEDVWSAHPGPRQQRPVRGQEGWEAVGFSTFSKPLGWMGAGREGQQPSRNTLPLSWSQAQPKSWRAGTEGQDRPGHNHCSVLAAPSPHAYTCTNTQPYANPKYTPSSHPHTCTRMQVHIYTPLDIHLCIFFQAEKPIPVALVLPLLIVPQTLWGVLLPPCQRPGATQAAHTINPLHTHV